MIIYRVYLHKAVTVLLMGLESYDSMTLLLCDYIQSLHKAITVLLMGLESIDSMTLLLCDYIQSLSTQSCYGATNGFRMV